MLESLMPKTAAFLTALVAGIGTLATSVPEIGDYSISTGAWGGVALGALSVLLAITGMIAAYMDRRKIESAKTSLTIIADQSNTIEYLQENTKFLRGQIEAMEKDVAETRKRAHVIADKAHARLLAKTSELATLKSWCMAQGINIPEFPHSDDDVIYPETLKESHEKQNP